MYFTAEFPANIDSQELYNDVKQFKMNVTDMITKVYMYGEVSAKYCVTLIQICYKYSYKLINIKKPHPLRWGNFFIRIFLVSLQALDYIML